MRRQRRPQPHRLEHMARGPGDRRGPPVPAAGLRLPGIARIDQHHAERNPRGGDAQRKRRHQPGKTPADDGHIGIQVNLRHGRRLHSTGPRPNLARTRGLTEPIMAASSPAVTVTQQLPQSEAGLLAILDLKKLSHNRFEATSPRDGWKRVFGGQVVAQALLAATRTVDQRPVHSLHGYFLRPGDPAKAILYEVDPHRDGKSFTTRGVLARQGDEIIFSMIASFHRPEPGFDHQAPMPDVAAPEGLPDEASLLASHGDRLSSSMQRYLSAGAAGRIASGRSRRLPETAGRPSCRVLTCGCACAPGCRTMTPSTARLWRTPPTSRSLRQLWYLMGARFMTRS